MYLGQVSKVWTKGGLPRVSEMSLLHVIFTVFAGKEY